MNNLTSAITGRKIKLCSREQADLMREAIWNSDDEMNTLDPQIGKIVNSLLFSIKTLDSVHIGVCGVYNYDINDGQVGIRIGDKKYWSKGYGTDAVSALVNYCLNTLGIKHIWLKVLPTNIRAIKCYEKCGFVKSGKMLYGETEFVTMNIRRFNHG